MRFLAMPRDELYTLAGFSRSVTLPVLESLQYHGWFGSGEEIERDLNAKEVRLGLLLQRDGQYLVESDGTLLHCLPVTERLARFGPGLAGLKGLAEAAARELFAGASAVQPELFGLLNEDRLPDARPFLILVYRLQLDSAADAPEGMVWVSARHLPDLALDPLSLFVVDSCREE